MALFLDRKYGESIMLGDDVRITVLEGKRRGQARVAIEAPKDVLILREELWLKQQKESDNEQSSNN